MEKKSISIICSKPTIAVASAISYTVACSGFAVILKCQDDADCEQATVEIRRLLDEKVSCQELTADQAEEASGSIKVTTHLPSCSKSGVIIETVYEDRDLKVETLKEIETISSDESIILTNSSTLTVTHLATTVEKPERVAGMHFIYFSPVMKVVEIVAGIKTSASTLEAANHFAADIGMETVTAEDAPGLLSTRIWMVHLNEAANNVFNKLVEAQSLVKMNRTISPKALSILESADFIGLDNCVALKQNLYSAYGDPKYLPSPLLTQMVDAGQLGIKSGKGFFNYS